MPEHRPKRASFYRAFLLSEGRRVDPAPRDWAQTLAQLGNRPLPERRLDDVIFERYPTNERPVLGMHKLIDTQFMTRIDTNGQVSDLLGEEGAPDFAHSTAVVFLDEGNVFALSVGSVSSPRAASVAHFLDAFTATPPGSHWAVEPLLDSGRIESLQQSRGLVEYQTRIGTSRDLFTQDDASLGISGFADSVANRLGGDVEITISIKLVPEARNMSTKAKLKDFVLGDLPRTATRGSGAKAKAVLANGAQEELSLVAHTLACDMELPAASGDKRQFSDLVRGILDAGSDMRDKVKNILEG